MLIVMKKQVREQDLEQVKQFLIDQDFDFHQSTGANRTILGVIGDTARLDPRTLEALAGVHVVFRIPDEETR
ncbi:hypothetical protein [Desulfuromonas thiophila]|uniref:DAHP synthase ferredoxin-like domain-containing protein n=1 Tax=Desulfuromonas thiophila TaxID=57664 RepID=A0A1G7AMB8_9BACT|nr:hypothetical protein [Desulfuromonas thiophila]SDE15932.1 hypothetical protein SAMN05661003_104119 [Desulfuromonas thiophila]